MQPYVASGNTQTHTRLGMVRKVVPGPDAPLSLRCHRLSVCGESLTPFIPSFCASLASCEGTAEV